MMPGTLETRRDNRLIEPDRPSARNTGAVITTHNPDPEIVERVLRVRPQVHGVLIVDNGSDAESRRRLDHLGGLTGVSLLLNTRNLGVAKALNQGLRWAYERGYCWLLTLDQDTFVRDDLVETIGRVFDAQPNKSDVALIGSAFHQERRVRPGPEAGWTEVTAVMTSGTLMSLPACKQIGLFRDEFFIDHVDWEYGLRARSQGFRVVQSLTPVMQHRIGHETRHQLLWKIVCTSNHAPARRYFLVRNHIRLAADFLFREPRWMLATLYTLLKSTALMCMFERDRLAKLRFTALGLWDGVRGSFHRDVTRGL